METEFSIPALVSAESAPEEGGVSDEKQSRSKLWKESLFEDQRKGPAQDDANVNFAGLRKQGR